MAKTEDAKKTEAKNAASDAATPETRTHKLWREWGKPFLIVAIVGFSFRSAVADWNDVPSGSMLPTILEGDRIFVNKLAYDLKVPFTTWHVATWGEPKRGDIVVFFPPADIRQCAKCGLEYTAWEDVPDRCGACGVAWRETALRPVYSRPEVRLVKRVIGVPGDTIQLVRNELFVNGEQAEYEPLEEELTNVIAIKDQPHYRFRRESVGEFTHPLLLVPSNPTEPNFGPVIVPDGHFFMMGDNRDNSRDSRVFGPVPRRRILGRATAVVASAKFEHWYTPAPRWSRFFTSLR